MTPKERQRKAREREARRKAAEIEAAKGRKALRILSRDDQSEPRYPFEGIPFTIEEMHVLCDYFDGKIDLDGNPIQVEEPPKSNVIQLFQEAIARR